MTHPSEVKNEILNIDPLQVAEDITGQNYKESNKAKALGFMLMQGVNQAKKEIYKERQDTYSSMPWDDFKDLLSLNGWKIPYAKRFQYEDREEKDWPEEIIAYESNLCFFIHATSWKDSKDETLNSGTMYCEMSGDGSKLMSKGSGGMSSHADYDHDDFMRLDCSIRHDLEPRDRYIFSLYYDVREGLFGLITDRVMLGTPRKWDRPSGSLLHISNYGDEKTSSDGRPLTEWLGEHWEFTLKKIKSIPELEEIMPFYFREDALEIIMKKYN